MTRLALRLSTSAMQCILEREAMQERCARRCRTNTNRKRISTHAELQIRFPKRDTDRQPGPKCPKVAFSGQNVGFTQSLRDCLALRCEIYTRRSSQPPRPATFTNSQSSYVRRVEPRHGQPWPRARSTGIRKFLCIAIRFENLPRRLPDRSRSSESSLKYC